MHGGTGAQSIEDGLHPERARFCSRCMGMCGAVMYEKLARGHATAYINGIQDYGRVLDWIEGPRPTTIMDAFERSSLPRSLAGF